MFLMSQALHHSLRAFQLLMFRKVNEEVIRTILILPMRKGKCREVRSLAQGHMAIRCQSCWLAAKPRAKRGLGDLGARTLSLFCVPACWGRVSLNSSSNCHSTSYCYPGDPNPWFRGKYFVHRFSGFRPNLLKSPAPTSGFLWTLFSLHLICFHGNCWAPASLSSSFLGSKASSWAPQ